MTIHAEEADTTAHTCRRRTNTYIKPGFNGKDIDYRFIIRISSYIPVYEIIHLMIGTLNREFLITVFILMGYTIRTFVSLYIMAHD